MAVVNAYGRTSTTNLVIHNLCTHFGGWAHVIMAYANVDVLVAALENDQAFATSNATVFQWLNAKWGTFLHLITPTRTVHFEHVALLLDDVMLPVMSGPYVPQMLCMMSRYGIGHLQPQVEGATHKSQFSTMYHDLRRVRGVEVFFTVFTREAWSCFASMFRKWNHGGCGYDLLFHTMCPNVVMAIDYNRVLFHLGKVIPRKDLRANMTLNEAQIVRGFDAQPVGKYSYNPCVDTIRRLVLELANITTTPGTLSRMFQAMPRDGDIIHRRNIDDPTDMSC